MFLLVQVWRSCSHKFGVLVGTSLVFLCIADGVIAHPAFIHEPILGSFLRSVNRGCGICLVYVVVECLVHQL